MAGTKTITPNETIASWRAAMSYSQRDAALALGCSRTALAGWEKEPATTPRYIRLAMAALALDIKVEGAPEFTTDDLGDI